VGSLVDDVIMPPVGLLLGGIDFSSFFIDLSGGGFASLAEAKAAGAATLRYGLFLNTIVNFVIVAFAVFLLVKQVNRLMPAPPPAATRDCPKCLSAIPVGATRCAHCCTDLGAPA
jgi:large conductance mechanosensitive channel